MSLRARIGVLLLAAGALLHSQTPLSLEEAVGRALATSTDLRITRMRAQAAVRAQDLSLRDYLPRLEVTINDTSSVVVGAPDTNSATLGFTVTQPIYQGGRLQAQRELARQSLVLEDRKGRIREDEIADQVRALYRQIQVQEQQLEIQGEIRAIAARQYEISRTERQIGSIRDVDLLEAELEVASIDLQIAQTRQGLEESLYGFRRLVGLAPDAVFRPEGAVDAAYAGIEVPDDPDFFHAIALENNAAVEEQELRIAQSLASLRDAARWYLPNLSVELSLSFAGSDLPLQTPSLSGKVMVGFPLLAFPVSTSLAAGGTPGVQRSLGSTGSVSMLDDVRGWIDRRAGEIEHRANLLRRDELRQDLRFQIAQALQTHRQRQHGLELKRRQIELEARKVSILQRQLELGEVKRIDYLKSESQLARDRISLLEEVLALLNSERELENLLGLHAGELEGLAASRQRAGGT